MPRPVIPPREPLADAISGLWYRIDGQHLLATYALPNQIPVQQGDFCVRYGIRLLGKAHLAIVPGLVALDYGDMLTGEDAWRFLLRGSNLHPRADVIGYRSDGKDDMIVLKTLDLAEPPVALLYTDDTATAALCMLNALLVPDHTLATVPQRLLTYLPRYPSLDAWQQDHTS